MQGKKNYAEKLFVSLQISAGQAFRMSANSVQRNDHWLGDYFRRMKSQGGNKYAIVATANKIATIYDKMVGNKVKFISVDKTRYQAKRTANKIAYMERKLADLKGKMMDLTDNKQAVAI